MNISFIKLPILGWPPHIGAICENESLLKIIDNAKSCLENAQD